MLSKIAIAASIAFASASARMNKHKQSPYDEGTAYYLGKCTMMNADDKKIGCLQFHQECTDLEEFEPTAMSARIRGLDASHYSIDVYDQDPMQEGAKVSETLGEFLPNGRDVLSVFGLYTESITLQGLETLEGGFIGLTCKDSGALVGSCEVEVM